MRACSAPGVRRFRALDSFRPWARPSSSLSGWLNFGNAANHCESSLLFWREPISVESCTRSCGSVQDSPFARTAWKNGDAESATELKMAIRNQESEDRLWAISSRAVSARLSLSSPRLSEVWNCT